MHMHYRRISAAKVKRQTMRMFIVQGFKRLKRVGFPRCVVEVRQLNANSFSHRLNVPNDTVKLSPNEKVHRCVAMETSIWVV